MADQSAVTEGQVLSDVHVDLPGFTVHVNQTDLKESRFRFKVPNSLMHAFKDSLPASDDSTSDGCTDGSMCDEDGDLVVRRNKEDGEEFVISIAHAMATDLPLVGQQVWLGALLLCDFMLHYNALFAGKVVVDLGAGVGLTSIVAALQANTVFCTDRGEDILSLAHHNIDHNSSVHQNSDIRVREVDWTAAEPLTAVSQKTAEQKQPFSLSAGDLEIFHSCSIILAAEVVYDQELTDAFFCLLYNLLLELPEKNVYMTVEKRQVFSIADKDVVSPAYEHFRENLQDLCSVDEGPVRFLCSQVDLSFPQYFHYMRTKELELWKIETVFVHR